MTIQLWDAEIEGQQWLIGRQHLIRFSSQFQHALFAASELVEQIESSPSRQFEDLVEVASSGWVTVGPLSSLLFWAPPTYHPRWYTSTLRMIFPPPDVQLDLSHMAHGTSWHLCYRVDE
jgi:hypothetical protein